MGTQLAFTATATDPDAGTTLTYSLANGTGGSVPAGATIGSSSGSFTWTPTAGQLGVATFDVCVSDGTASDCETISVTVTAGGLVGDWKADEGSGTTLVDSSGLANNGTILGNPTWVAGQHGQAIRFDGTGDYATVADNASLDISGAITMATWVKPEKVATQYLIKKAIQSGTDGYELSLATTGFPFVRFNATASMTTYRVDSPTAYPSDGTTWMHLAATSDGTTIRLYVNGAEVATKPAPAAITTNNLALGIGGQSDGVSTLQGAMDDVLLYNRALSASEVAALGHDHPRQHATHAGSDRQQERRGRNRARLHCHGLRSGRRRHPDLLSRRRHLGTGARGGLDHERWSTSPGRRPPARSALTPSMCA